MGYEKVRRQFRLWQHQIEREHYVDQPMTHSNE